MKQRVLGLGLSIVLLIAWAKLEIPTIGQTLPPAHNLDDEKLEKAKQLNQQVLNLIQQGKYDEAIPVAKTSLAILEKILGNKHPNVATIINNLASLYDFKGDYAQAALLYQYSLNIREKAFGLNHPDVANSLYNLGGAYHSQGKYTQAEQFYQRALGILVKDPGSNDKSIAIVLTKFAGLYESQGKYLEAEQLYQRALSVQEKGLGIDYSDIANSLSSLAGFYEGQGKYTEAEEFYQRALAIREKALGQNHVDFANSLNSLAGIYRSQGKYTQAEQFYQRSLAILIRVLPSNYPDIAYTLNGLALLYKTQAKYKEAELNYRLALDLREKALGQNHVDVANSLHNLAALYETQGKHDQAEQLSQRSLFILEKALGKKHPDVAKSLNGLALLYSEQGKYVQAEPLYQRSLSILEEFLPNGHPTTANTLNNLSAFYGNQGKYTQAEPLAQKALAIREKFLSKDHPDVANSLNNLALLYINQGKYVEAELLAQKALVIREKALGKEHPDVAAVLNNLAALYDRQSKYAEAEPLYRRSLDILEKYLGKDHPNIATILNNLATMYTSQKKYVQALEFHGRSSIIEERILSRVLAIGSERDKQNYVNNISTSPDFSIHLAFQSQSVDAQRLAIITILRRQGRILDATAETIQRIRPRLKDRPDLQILFDDWKNILQEQSALDRSNLKQENPKEYRARYEKLNQLGQEMESQLSNKSVVFRQTVMPVELEKVQKLIPQDAALVHIVRYQPYNSKVDNTKRLTPPRYTAATLRTTGNPHWVDLGTAAEIEKNIQTFRTYLQDGSGTSNLQRNKIARTLHAQLIQPLRQHLGDTKHLLLSSDAALNLIPFEALQDENNKYLIEQYTFSYLTSGRDLLRFPAAPPSRQAPIVFSEIDYQANFSPLATQAETNQIQTIFPNAQIIRDRAATKTALQQVQAPQILHLATHGFFKPAPKDTIANLDNPLTRSGIVLAGADSRSGVGILTGLEASALDLYGTQLVVLSACETGLGDISTGEGIYGLRRALVIAGSQSQVLSLWKVGDTATVELMKLFYQNLKAGMGRHEALRDAQLKLLRHPNYQNPYNWAAFIPSGNWKPLPK
jgi:CHAT domain-containing protein/Tfp pilus assembly protein PilF